MKTDDQNALTNDEDYFYQVKDAAAELEIYGLPAIFAGGSLLDLSGVGFSRIRSENEIVFDDGTTAEILSASWTGLQAIIPALGTSGFIRIRSPNGSYAREVLITIGSDPKSRSGGAAGNRKRIRRRAGHSGLSAKATAASSAHLGRLPASQPTSMGWNAVQALKRLGRRDVLQGIAEDPNSPHRAFAKSLLAGRIGLSLGWSPYVKPGAANATTE